MMAGERKISSLNVTVAGPSVSGQRAWAGAELRLKCLREAW